MKILGIIPARAGSKRIAGKNTKLLAGKPLVQYAIEAALDAEKLDSIVVNSDSEEVLKIASAFDRVVPLKRPAELATDISPAIDYVRHTLEYLRQTEKQNFDIVAIIQPTSPFTKSEDIDHTIRKLIDTRADSAVSIVKLQHDINPLKLKILKDDRLLPYLEEEKGRMAAHELPEIYVRNCAVYTATMDTINQGLIIGEDCRAYEMPAERSIDINDPLDFAFAEFLLTKKTGALP